MNVASARRPFLTFAAPVGWLAVCLLVVGCSKDQDYLDVIEDQDASRKEITEILRTVNDAPTMADAKKTLEANADKYAEIARRASALPNPPPQRVQEQMKSKLFVIQRTIEHLQTETARVARLPGGPEFLKQFESTKGLLTAVQP